MLSAVEIRKLRGRMGRGLSSHRLERLGVFRHSAADCLRDLGSTT